MSWVQDEYIRVMLKHLPPSAAALSLLDIGVNAAAVMLSLRQDLEIELASLDPGHWAYATNSFDAAIAYDVYPSRDMLAAVLAVLRPGGRFILINPLWDVEAQQLKRLETAGYVRILVEPALDSSGVLMRGEKAHTTDSTVQRVQQVAQQDANLLDLNNFAGRYVHLLVQQRPNKPVWKLRPDEQINWQAVTVEIDEQMHLLAFSSLPKAVAFMQPAVVAAFVNDVNKVAKFSKATAATWQLPVILNPALTDVGEYAVAWVAIDPDTAEAPDE